MSSTNSVHLIGNLTRDQEVKYTAGGLAIGRFAVAQNYRIKKGEEWVDAVNFFDVTMFGTRTESLAQYLKKGQPVAIEGELRQDRWQDDAGQTKSRVYVIVNDIKLLAKREGAEGQQSAPQPGPSPQYQAAFQSSPHSQAATGKPMDSSDFFEDDIPF